MLPELVNVVLMLLGARGPKAHLDDPDNLILRHKAPVTTVVRDRTVVPQNKVHSLWDLGGAHILHPVILFGN